jgi:hypothetical protein
MCYGESEPGDGDEDVVVDDAPADDGEEEEIPEEARAMIHDEVGKDPFMRDKGNIERIVMAR